MFFYLLSVLLQMMLRRNAEIVTNQPYLAIAASTNQSSTTSNETVLLLDGDDDTSCCSLVKSYGNQCDVVEDNLSVCSSTNSDPCISLLQKQRSNRLSSTANSDFSELSDSGSDDENSGDCVFMSGTSSENDDEERSADRGFIDNTTVVDDSDNDSLSTYSRSTINWDEELEQVGGWAKFLYAHPRN
jgi:hypothetical protein